MPWLGRKDHSNPLLLPALILRGTRVYVRPPAPGDWASWSALRGANRDNLKNREPTWPDDSLSEEFFAKRLKRQGQDWYIGAAYSFLIFRADSTLIGGININHVARGAAQNASLGYWLDADQQGQGYMREALALVIAYGFDTLKLHRLNAACLPENTKSISLLKSLQFEEEGFAKSYYRIDGKWQDHVLFGRVRPESEPSPEQPE